MAKNSPATSKKVQIALHEMKEGTLKTGTGKKVTDPKQAIAIGLSEAREDGKKVAPQKKAAKKTATKKTATKKTATKKATAKKPSASKASE
jgi:topoisomerase IA-like protein